MVTNEERKFIDYWEKNNAKQKRLLYQLAVGLPIGLVFGLPIMISLIFSDWYKNMQFISASQVTVILIAVLGIAVFFALFRMKHKWDMNEQFYKELKFKEGRDHDNKDRI
jgi:membrane protein YdbS with pleckstrin-like domain